MTSGRTPLTCSNCHLPLSLSSKAQPTIRCPRCNTWMDLDPACLGSCMSCHKAHQADPAPCTEEESTHVTITTTNSPGVSNNYCPNVVQTKRWANVGPVGLLKRAWKVLTNGLF